LADPRSLAVEPGVERLWKARILVTHARGNTDTVLEQLRTDTVPNRSGLTPARLGSGSARCRFLSSTEIPGG
jgi:hypothetical protein